ncbi:MAG: hypothetical protein ACTTH8_05365 [Treponema sp.]
MQQHESGIRHTVCDKCKSVLKAGCVWDIPIAVCIRCIILICMLSSVVVITAPPLSAQNAPETASDSGQASTLTNTETDDETALLEEDSGQDDFDAEETALDIKFGGAVETAHGVQLMQPFQYAASRIVANLFTDAAFENTSARIAAAAEYNHLTPQKTGIILQEAYCTYRSDYWDMSIGRQFISWGQADGFRITDRLTARDMREAVASPHNTIASDAVRFRVLHDNVTFETVFVPFFTPDVLPPFDFEYEHSAEKKPFFTVDTSDAAIPFPVTKILKPAVKPRRFIDTETAARLSFFLPALDFSISGFYGWDKIPKFNKKFDLSSGLSSAKFILAPEYYRIGTAGFDAAVPAGDFVFRFEAAGVFDKYFEPAHPTMDLTTGEMSPALKKNQLLMLAGIDWNRSGWVISMQYLEDLVFCKKDELKRGLHQGTVSLSVSKTLLRERLKLAASGLVDITDGGTASTYSVSYTLSDLLTISGGADVYTKGQDKSSTFARLHTATNGWLKARLSF